MLFLYSIILLIFNIKCRLDEDMYTIRKEIISRISKISFSIEINGTNDYIYTFKTKNIFLKSNNITTNDTTIYLDNPIITILLNLSIYDNNNNNNFLDIENCSFKERILHKLITVNIKFKSILYKKNKDFSFDISTEMVDKHNDINMYIDNLKDIKIFKYLIFDEKNERYNNKTFFEYSKQSILDTILIELEKNLAYYPECDSLHYIKSLINYFLYNPIKHYIPFTKWPQDIIIYFIKVNNFEYKEIIRNNKIIILKNIKVNLYIEFENNNINIDDNEDGTFMLDYITIDQNYTINYSKISSDKEHLLEAFKKVVNLSEEQFNKINYN